MAKPRKPKNEDSKPENSGAVVRRQKLCLSIDMDKRQVYGYTELEIAVPEIGIVGLHAENLGIMRVSVDGEPADFEYYPNQQLENEKRWSSVKSPSSAADVAASVYMSALEKELIPNLLINCCKAFKNGYEQQDQTATENGIQSSGDTKQNVRLIRIDYWVEKGESGIHFKDNVLHTDNQIRRARCWFPCIDDTSQQCCYDLEFTVAHHLVAVSNGSLLYQVLSKDNPPRKTYVYKLEIPVAARWISLAVAPFAILPDHGVSLISHMCLQPNLPELRNTVEFFHNAFSSYRDYLSVDFPFDSYKQVFIEPDMAVSSLISGASLSILSTQLLFDEKIIDQTIDTRIKLAYALARQWFGVYITPESANDEWLVDGLAGYLTDLFIKKHLGNNEARYRRYKANCAVCKADDGGVTALSNTTSCKDLYGTHCIGFYGKIRSWKSVAILQMLEKQMGPESFRKVLQTIVSRAQDKTCALRSLSTKEFRHFANKVGNLERPFLKEFFPRWVGSYGCPVLRMGFSYNKRKNMVELAVFRECTASSNSSVPILNTNSESENRDGEIGWPGMMSIRVYELDGMYDHPILPMAGEPWQLLEIQCHSRLAVRRFQKPKKGAKADGSDDNVDVVPALDMRSSTETPLIWMRADPEMEYLAKIRFNQPVQMWINQLEKDKDVIAQAQAIENLEALPRLPFSVVNALHNFLSDSKAYWRVRIEAAFALASTASEETEWAGLLNLVTFYKSRRFDLNIGLPKPNDFHDFSEYFVLEAIPHAVATVRAEDKKSPREAVEFVLQLLKYNDNSGNPYSDVFWLAALVQSVGELEFGQQSILLLSSLLKRIDRLLQFDRLMPSYNGILTISCIQTLTQIALKLSEFIPLDRVIALITPFQDLKATWKIRVEASRALLDLEYYCKGIDAALLLFVKFLEEEPSLRGQLKLGVHAIRLCQMRSRSNPDSEISIQTLVALLHVLDGRTAFNNVYLRHHLFCVFQILAGRPPTLFGVPRENRMLQIVDADICNVPKDIFDVLDSEIRPLAPCGEPLKDMQSTLAIPEVPTESCTAVPEEGAEILEQPPAEIDNKPPVEIAKVPPDIETPNRGPKELDSASVGQDQKKAVVKIRVKQSSATSKAETDNQTTERSLGHNEVDHGASSSVSVDAPQKQREFTETVSTNNYNVEEANSWHDVGSRMTASIGSAKLVNDGEEVGKDLLCTADSSLVYSQYRPEDPSSCSIFKDNSLATEAQNFASPQSLSVPRVDLDGGADISKHKKEKKKDKEKIRKRDHPGRSEDLEYLERKRLKKEKKRKEKEIAKLLLSASNAPKVDLSIQKEGNAAVQSGTIPLTSKSETNEAKAVAGGKDKKPAGFEGTSNTPKFRIKIKNRTLNK